MKRTSLKMEILILINIVITIFINMTISKLTSIIINMASHSHAHDHSNDHGVWKRRNDDYSEIMLEEKPVAPIMENRGLTDPKVNVKSYLKNMIILIDKYPKLQHPKNTWTTA